MLYVVVWCAIFSTLHLYISIANYWVLCLCVSLVAIFLTAAIIFILHHSNKEVQREGSTGQTLSSSDWGMKTLASPFLLIPLFLLQLNVNIDVRLIQVNERLVKHKLLVAVADWVQNCSGNIQVDFEWLTFTPLDLVFLTLLHRWRLSEPTQIKY